jgi:urease accessory protein
LLHARNNPDGTFPAVTLTKERPGHAELAVDFVEGQSTLVRARAKAPLRLLVPTPRGRAVWAYSSSLGGGLLDGDDLDLHITLTRNATACLLSQSTNKVYRAVARGARQSLHAEVPEGALLALLPDPVCCFAHARFCEQQEVRLHAGASLVLQNGVLDGRAARGERWAFSSYQSRTRVWLDGELRVYDALRLDGEFAARLAETSALGWLLALGPRAEGLATHLLQRLPRAQPGPLQVSASRITDGVMVRTAGEAALVQAFMHAALRPLTDELGGDPFTRRF